MTTSTLTRSSSGKEPLLPFRELFHALQGFLFRHNRAGRALHFDFFGSLQFLHLAILSVTAFTHDVNQGAQSFIRMSLRCGKGGHIGFQSGCCGFQSGCRGFDPIQPCIRILRELHQKLERFLQSSQPRIIANSLLLQALDIDCKLSLLLKNEFHRLLNFFVGQGALPDSVRINFFSFFLTSRKSQGPLNTS